MKNIIRIAVVTTLLLGISAMAGVAPASAANPRMATTGNMRDCINTSLTGCTARYRAGANLPVTMHCWLDGSWATGLYRSNRWFMVTIKSTTGFVHSSVVTNQVSVPNCAARHTGVMASKWAAERVGVVHTTAAERAAFGYNTPYWSGYCAGFTSTAYRHGAGRTPRFAGDAGARFRQYQRAGLVSSTPSLGAMVFWPNVSSWGHTAIYIGNGMVATTNGVPGQVQANSRVSVNAFGAPAGYVASNKI